MAREWILREDGVLCLSGYPVRIAMTPKGPGPFCLVSDAHGSASPYWLLNAAKADGERLADDIDEFTPMADAGQPADRK